VALVLAATAIAGAAPAPGAPPAAPVADAPVAAAPAPDQVAAYEAAVETGTTAFRAGRFLEARTAFELAYSIHPDPVLLFNIASCWRRVGDREAAIAAYHRFLDSAPVDDDRRRLALDTIRRLEGERVTIAAGPTPRRLHRRRGLSRTAKIGLGVVGIGAASLVAAAVEAHRASKREDELEALAPGTPWDRAQADRYEEGEDAKFRARLFAGAGDDQGGSGATLVLVGGREEKQEVAALKITAQSGGFQLNVRRRF